MNHEPWKGILLHAVKEFAKEYPALRDKDKTSAEEQLWKVVDLFTKGDFLTLKDLHDFQYDPNALFYLELLDRLEDTDSTLALEATVAHAGWIRRHRDPAEAIAMLLSVLTDLSPGLRSTAQYEMAQAYRKMGGTPAAVQYLMDSARSAEEAGNHLQSLMNQAVAASWEAETNSARAEPTIRALRREFLKLVEENDSERETAERWYMNCTYHLAKIAAKSGNHGTLGLYLQILEDLKYQERKWITEAQLQELRAAL